MNRYLFTVRKPNFFATGVSVDCFHELDMTKPDECVSIINSMSLRTRFNADMYPNVLQINSESPIDRDGLEMVLSYKFGDELESFLKDATVC